VRKVTGGGLARLAGLAGTWESWLVMSQRSRKNVVTLTVERLCRAIRYQLQLAVEWQTDGAVYQDGVVTLADVVTTLLEHEERRAIDKKTALFVSLVPLMREHLLRVVAGKPWIDEAEPLRRQLRESGLGIFLGHVNFVLKNPVRAGARARTATERVTDQIGQLAERALGSPLSQSDLEKAEAVAFRGAETDGKLGNAPLFARALADFPPPKVELLLQAFSALDVEREVVERCLPGIDWDALLAGFDERAELGEVVNAGQEAKARRRDEKKRKKVTKEGAETAEPKGPDALAATSPPSTAARPPVRQLPRAASAKAKGPASPPKPTVSRGTKHR
jgi:hypothetical protein